MSDNFIKVAVDYPIRPSILTYLSPEDLVQRGDLVQVPLGRRKAKGCVLEHTTELPEGVKPEKLKPVEGIIDNSFSIGEKELELYQWMSQYYHYSLGQLIFDCVPKFLKRPRDVEFLIGKGRFEELTPNEEQKVAIDRMLPTIGQGFSRHYLHGITGSGKTYVYLNLIKECLKQKKSVLFMIPEINLTPQFTQVFEEQLDCPIFPYHSALNNSHKYSIWKMLKENKGPFLIMGVRSSVFLPIENLGLVIVDEEHDSSFKQSDRCTYNGRDVAIKKAQISGAPVLLGSATPTIENYFHYHQKENCYELKQRASGASLPDVVLLDERTKEYDEEIWPFHSKTILQLEEVLKKGEQALVFNNRLGFANYLQCRACGYTFTDPNTDTNLRLFKSKGQLRSMHSDYWIPIPQACPTCGNMNMLQKGYGTEKITEVLQKQFPGYKIGRFDRDEIKNFDQLGKTLEDFHNQDIDVLVGTQMLSKGHNFKKVNNVFILGSDSQLNFPDFRSQENVFQMLMQVCGRAGRYSQDSTVYIQTLNADSDLYQFVRANDLDGFYKMEMGYRQNLGYPPYSHLAAIYMSHRFKDKLTQSCSDMTHLLEQLKSKNGLDVEIWGPTPLVIEKRAGQFTWCYQIRSQSRKDLHQLISGMEHFYKTPSGVSLKLDIDPYHVL
jgi:primosomal protein N' (replication factor Y)